MTLPLPEHDDHVDARFKRHNCYTAEQMKAYGQACREVALEEAAMAAEDGFKYALKDAARLASRALNRIDAADIRLDTGERLSIAKAITALKAVL